MHVSWPRTGPEEKRAEGKDQGMKAEIMAAVSLEVGCAAAEGW